MKSPRESCDGATFKKKTMTTTELDLAKIFIEIPYFFIKKSYFLFNYTITKKNTRKTKHKYNIMMFIWDNDHFIKNKTKIIYKNKFKIKQILNNKIKKNKKKRECNKRKRKKETIFFTIHVNSEGGDPNSYFGCIK
jgi:hypothetical protein